MKIGDNVMVIAEGERVMALVTELAPRQVRLQYKAPGWNGTFQHWFHAEGGPRPGFRMGDHGQSPHRTEAWPV